MIIRFISTDEMKMVKRQSVKIYFILSNHKDEFMDNYFQTVEKDQRECRLWRERDRKRE
jgi:hypothetical protein